VRRRRIIRSSGGRSEEFDRLARDLEDFQGELDEARQHADVEDIAEELRDASATVTTRYDVEIPSPGDATSRRRRRGR